MTKGDSEKLFYMLDATSHPIQKTKSTSFRRYSIDIGLEERKLDGNIRKVNSLDQSMSQYISITCTEDYGESILLENEERGKIELIEKLMCQ